MAQRFTGLKVLRLKLVLLGASEVGKSSLALRFANDEFYPFQAGTAEGAFFSRTVDFDDSKITYDIWDTSGHERYRSLAPLFYCGAHAVLIVYDITSEDSFESALAWVKEIKQKTNPSVVIAVAGNKTDLANDRAVDYEEGLSYAKQNGLLFMETSALTALNVKEIFLAIAKKIPNNDLKEQEVETDDVDLFSAVQNFCEDEN